MSPRLAQPQCFRHFLRQFQEQPTASVEQLVTLLMKDASYEKHVATEMVTNAISDGMLVATTAAQKVVRLPRFEELTKLTQDCYCFECHLPGILESCRTCSRAFHRLCYRKDPELPIYLVPSVKLQKNQLPIFCDTDSGSDSNCAEAEQSEEVVSLISAPTTTPVAQLAAAAGGATEPTLEDKPRVHDLEQLELETKADVVYLGQVRPPTRKRPNAVTQLSNLSYKSELLPVHDDEVENDGTDADLCTCCRLLKLALLRNPPNMQKSEICYLLGFTFTRHREWIPVDLPCYMDDINASPEIIKLISQLLFVKPTAMLGLKQITDGLQAGAYTFLMEFMVDILDYQHSVGVFFGRNSVETESTHWMVRDIMHDLEELRRCPDCFRYSYETRTELWFAKPCRQRHELVYAKQSGFPYWPAKVVRVLPKDRYDVRFFGGDHSRALIEACNIRPIDTDRKTLKMGNSLSMQRALQELHYHQILSKYPPSKFNFYADPVEVARIIQSVLGGIEPGRGRGRPRKLALASSTGHPTGAPTATDPEWRPKSIKSVSSSEKRNTRSRTAFTATPAVANKKPRSSITATSGAASEPPAPIRELRSRNSPATDEIALMQLLDHLHRSRRAALLKEKKLKEQLRKAKKTVKEYETEKHIIKRKQWCHWCLNEAMFLCCFCAFYCSSVCQQRHWLHGHSEVCRNRRQKRDLPK